MNPIERVMYALGHEMTRLDEQVVELRLKNDAFLRLERNVDEIGNIQNLYLRASRALNCLSPSQWRALSKFVRSLTEPQVKILSDTFTSTNALKVAVEMYKTIRNRSK